VILSVPFIIAFFIHVVIQNEQALDLKKDLAYHYGGCKEM
jgi:hypothetical protein